MGNLQGYLPAIKWYAMLIMTFIFEGWLLMLTFYQHVSSKYDNVYDILWAFSRVN